MQLISNMMWVLLFIFYIVSSDKYLYQVEIVNVFSNIILSLTLGIKKCTKHLSDKGCVCLEKFDELFRPK